MDSMAALAKATRFSGLEMASVIGMVIAGYLALAGSAFFAFHEGADASLASVEETPKAGPVVVCDCHYDAAAPTACVTN